MARLERETFFTQNERPIFIQDILNILDLLFPYWKYVTLIDGMGLPTRVLTVEEFKKELEGDNPEEFPHTLFISKYKNSFSNLIKHGDKKKDLYDFFYVDLGWSYLSILFAENNHEHIEEFRDIVRKLKEDDISWAFSLCSLSDRTWHPPINEWEDNVCDITLDPISEKELFYLRKIRDLLFNRECTSFIEKAYQIFETYSFCHSPLQVKGCCHNTTGESLCQTMCI